MPNDLVNLVSISLSLSSSLILLLNFRFFFDRLAHASKVSLLPVSLVSVDQFAPLSQILPYLSTGLLMPLSVSTLSNLKSLWSRLEQLLKLCFPFRPACSCVSQIVCFLSNCRVSLWGSSAVRVAFDPIPSAVSRIPGVNCFGERHANQTLGLQSPRTDEAPVLRCV